MVPEDRAKAPERARPGIDEQLGELDADGTFWRFQARSLALFATPGFTGDPYRNPAINTYTSAAATASRIAVSACAWAVPFQGFAKSASQGS